VFVAMGAALSALLLAHSALAEPKGELTLELEGCEDVEETALRALLSIELSTLHVAPRGLRLSVSCVGTSATLALDAGDTAPPQELNVELGAVDAGARTRLVALTASELIAKFQPHAAPVQKPPKQPAPERNEELADTSEAKDGTATRNEWWLSGSLRRGGAPATSLFGGALGAEHWLDRVFSLAGELRAERGRTHTPLASVDWTPSSVSAAAFAGGQVGRLHLRTGPGFRAGWLLLDAHANAPNQGQRLSRGWLSGSLFAHVSFDLSRNCAILTGFEAGYVAWPVRGDVLGGGTLVDANGAWLGGTLGVALVL
jgi:hypothetical protein